MSDVIEGDCVEVMRAMEPDSIDAIVTDPPYGFGFMGRTWDKAIPLEWATEALRVLKPGGHLLAFGGPRTFHRLTCGVEDAGFEIRDCLAWLFGSGFPKSLDVSKAIDKAAGAKREITRPGVADDGRPDHIDFDPRSSSDRERRDSPATDLARQWEGWGTALKPAWEPCIVARKPLIGTVAANVTRYGTGALNIDVCRIETDDNLNGGTYSSGGRAGPMPGDDRTGAAIGMFQPGARPDHKYIQPAGRWPANVALDEEAARQLDEQSGERRSAGDYPSESRASNASVYNNIPSQQGQLYGDTGGASRFYYTAKASRSEREAWGRLALPVNRRSDGRAKDIENPRLRTSARINDHPTVKPLALMEWLIKLVTPEGGLILDPFCGSGSTLVAARRLNVRAIGIEQDARSAEIARQRIEAQWEVQLL